MTWITRRQAHLLSKFAAFREGEILFFLHHLVSTPY